MAFASALALSLFAVSVNSQFPPKPEGVTVLPSRFHPGVTISYKEPGICETTPGVKSYAGYVHLPVEALNETFEHNGYPINTFYWFFESRKDPANAPLTIWLNGGPGASSLLGALSENGPCFINNDSMTTTLNPWSWNNEANLLVIDQPNQVGYSYDVLTNVTVNIASDDEGGAIKPADFDKFIPETNNTFLVGTAGSQLVNSTANSTLHAAVALWHFAQTFFEEFPAYKPNDERISLFTESYGGHYGPGIIDFFIHQNELISNGTISGPGAHYLHLSTLGIINGCIDMYDLARSYVTFPYNNTYGIQVYNQSRYEWALNELEKPGGGNDAIAECRRLQNSTDDRDHKAVRKLNAMCSQAEDQVMGFTEELFAQNDNAARFDITHEAQDPFPAPYMFGWLNQAHVQQALGVPVNHTWASSAVGAAFSKTGDFVKGGQLQNLAYILDHGVNVALLHGDRDYACNWVAGEASSLSIPWSSKAKFAEAGYAPVALSSPYVQSGGLVRQYGNLSFTRVYQAGHMVPSYQPEAAYDIFMRAITHRDIATGQIDLREVEHYATTGPKDTWWSKSDILPAPPHECYIPALMMRCSDDEIASVINGTALVKDWILVGKEETRDEVTVVASSQTSAQKPLVA